MKFELERDVDCRGHWLVSKSPHFSGPDSKMFVSDTHWDDFVRWVAETNKYILEKRRV